MKIIFFFKAYFILLSNLPSSLKLNACFINFICCKNICLTIYHTFSKIHHQSRIAIHCSKLQDMYASITNVTTFEDQISIIDIENLVVTVDKLLELRRNVCRQIFHNGNLCGSSLHYEISGCGNVKVIQWTCDKKHVGKWGSSEILT